MEGNGFDPSAVTYSQLIARCERGGQWEKAVQLFEDMEVRKAGMKGTRPSPADVVW